VLGHIRSVPLVELASAAKISQGKALRSGYGMPSFLRLRRCVLFGLSLLSACGAADFGQSADASRPDPIDMKVSSPMGAYLAGRAAVSDGDMPTAAGLFLQGLSLDPDNADLRSAAFTAALRAGRPEAVALARDLPGSVAAQLLLADVDAKAGHWAAAEGRFAGIVRQGPVQLLQPILVAWAQYGEGRTDAALATLKPLVDGDRFRGTYAIHAALIADLSGHNADAERDYHIAQTSSGGINLELARLLASWYVRTGHAAEAQQLFSSFQQNVGNVAIAVPGLYHDAAQRHVRNAIDGLAESYLALASAVRGQGGEVGDDMARALLQLALDLRPDLTLARELSAEMLDDGHHPHAALAMLSHVADSDPLLPMVQLRRASLFAEIHQPDAALQILDTLAVAFPDRAETYSMRGDILRDAKRFPEAVKAFSGAISRLGKEKPENWALYYERGIAYERLQDWPDSEKDFLHALELSSDQPFVLNYLGYSWTEQGRNLDKARRMIERAVALRPDDGAIIDSLGWVVLRQGDIAGAVRLLQRAVELVPADPTMNGHLGDAYWAAGRKLEAQFQWRRALTLNPEPEDVPKLQAKLLKSEAALGNLPAKTVTP
jgi:tetratricopeptide (TPR) repeat protein